jgi:acetyltransferase-like isoleucine patch superfamily enzyme
MSKLIEKDIIWSIAKRIVLIIPLTRRWYELGYFSRTIRRQRLINFIFQRILRQNCDSPWSVNFTSRIVFPHKIQIGSGVERSLLFSPNCYIQGGNGVEIGDGTRFGPGVKIISANHNPSNMSQWLPDKPIKVGRNCWIGANAVVLPGVELGNNVIVGAGAVVTKSCPANMILIGNPATAIKNKCHDKHRMK